MSHVSVRDAIDAAVSVASDFQTSGMPGATALVELGLDSLAVFEVISILEEELGFDFEWDNVVEEPTTIEDVVVLVHSYLG